VINYSYQWQNILTKVKFCLINEDILAIINDYEE